MSVVMRCSPSAEYTQFGTTRNITSLAHTAWCSNVSGPINSSGMYWVPGVVVDPSPSAFFLFHHFCIRPIDHGNKLQKPFSPPLRILLRSPSSCGFLTAPRPREK